MRPGTMTKLTWVVSFLVTAAAGAITLLWLGFGLPILPSSDLRARLHPPHPPSQPTSAILACTYTYKYELIPEIGGDWGVRTSDGGCSFSGVLLSPVAATHAEILLVHRRPRISFRVAPNGRISNVTLTRGSGSPTLDQRAVSQVQGQRYRRHDCGICKVSTVIDIEYDGPVWTRDTLQ
jgi:TonB family protein